FLTLGPVQEGFRHEKGLSPAIECPRQGRLTDAGEYLTNRPGGVPEQLLGSTAVLARGGDVAVLGRHCRRLRPIPARAPQAPPQAPQADRSCQAGPRAARLRAASA